MLRSLKASESSIQSSFIKWINLQYPAIADVTASFPNGGKRTGRYGNRLKREGMKKGFLDLGMFVPSGEYHGLFIEFKDLDGKLTDEQKVVWANLVANGYKCVLCRSLAEAIKETNLYLSYEVSAHRKISQMSH